MDLLRVEDQITFIYCSDLNKTSCFYEELLGLQLVLDQGNCRIVRVAEKGGGYLGYCQRPVNKTGRAGVILTLVVPERSEVDAWYEKLAASKVSLPQKPRLNSEYGIYHFFFRDPDGYTLEIQSFLDPGWKRSEE